MIYTLSPLTTLRTQTPTTNHCILSDIPSPGGVWGGCFSLVLGPLLFGVCFLFFVKFFPFCFSIYALLPSKRRPFTLQKGIF